MNVYCYRFNFLQYLVTVVEFIFTPFSVIHYILQYCSHHNSERVWFHCDFIYYHFVTNTNKA